MLVSPDLPISTESEDKLDVLPLVSNLVNLLVKQSVDETVATRLVVGVTGSWGSGKSSVLNLVKQRLADIKGVAIVDFNPWILQNSDDLIRSFIRQLSLSLGQSQSEKLRAVAKQFSAYGEVLAAVVDTQLPGAGGIFKKVFASNDKPLSLEEARADLVKKLSENGTAIVVVIDELDRVEADEIKQMARLMKAVADLPGISYLVAYDRLRVERALAGGNVEEGATYLKKIVQIALPLRPLLDSEAFEMVEQGLLENKIPKRVIDSEQFSDVIRLVCRHVETPRDVKRLISLFSTLTRMLDGEIFLPDLLAYSALATHNPSVRDLLSQKIDAFVNDPTDFEYVNRRMEEKEKSPSKILSVDMDNYTESLLKTLFPVFGGRADQNTFGRLQSKLNLLAVLYMGNPPFRLSKKETGERLDRLDDESIHEMFKSGTIFDFLGNLSLMKDTFPTDGLEEKVRRLADYLSAKTGEESLRAWRCLTQLRNIILGQIGIDHDGALLARAIFDRLNADCELLLRAMLLRSHMFAHGLVKDQRRSGEETFLSKDQTLIAIDEIEREAWSYIQAGMWQDRTAAASLFYLLVQSGLYSEAMREEVTGQIVTQADVIGLAVTFCPPGIGTDANVLDKFFDLHVVRELLVGLNPDDEFRSACVKSLKDILGVD